MATFHNSKYDYFVIVVHIVMRVVEPLPVINVSGSDGLHQRVQQMALASPKLRYFPVLNRLILECQNARQ